MCRLNSCPSRNSSIDCSGNGICIDGVCTCDAMFTGEACDIPVCPNSCSYSNGVCRREQHKCECNPKYKGIFSFLLFTFIYYVFHYNSF